jgi:hypothetical protein
MAALPEKLHNFNVFSWEKTGLSGKFITWYHEHWIYRRTINGRR